MVQLQNLSLSCNLTLGRNFADMENFDIFLSSSPVLKRVNMSVGTTTEPFRPDSKLYEAESIKVTQHSPTVPDIFSRFQGRQVFLRWTSGGDLELELWRFVNEWITGETFQNLEYLKVEISKTIGPQFLNLISARRIDEEDKPPTHTLPKV
ncbi:Protein CBG25188 [Caenorhabditis briggsae]|uniref:Protein CBG25188 n=1 Tax=Caenorhabditis briggsae TaxID=6238 RepID=B6IM13_CAEBR|nr:Protein CBG25188 [Caenorhabditis briggsae]CAS00943.1 Protein CBG25188 [Caenorhabditis briggsae]